MLKFIMKIVLIFIQLFLCNYLTFAQTSIINSINTSGNTINILNYKHSWSVGNIVNIQANVANKSFYTSNILPINSTILSVNNIYDKALEVNIYPNPIKDFLYINSTLNENFNIKIYDVLGNDILSENNISGTIKTIHLESLKPGVYLLYINCNYNSKSIKIFKN